MLIAILIVREVIHGLRVVIEFGISRKVMRNSTSLSRFTCVSVSISDVATSNLFGLLRYLFCRNCFSNSRSCWDVKAVLGLLVLPSNACCAAQPITKKIFCLRNLQFSNGTIKIVLLLIRATIFAIIIHKWKNSIIKIYKLYKKRRTIIFLTSC